MGLEVEQDDIQELIDKHSEQLMTEELLPKEQQQEVVDEI